MIDARGLHGWLGNKERFTQWAARRIMEYGFAEGLDFFRSFGKTKGRPRIDYLLTINMAKELAMIERTAIGSQTRRYFIEMEQVALEEIDATIASYGFWEGADFTPILVKTGGRPKSEYLLTIGMAKELEIIERSNIGSVTRRYLIKMEQVALG